MSSLVDELWPALLPGAAAAALGVASVTAAVLCAFPPRIKVSLSSAGGSVAARSAGAGSANAHMAGVGADTAEAAPAASKLSRPSITMIARLGVALGLLALVPGPAGLVAAIGGYVFSGRLLAKLEPGEVRRRREQLEALAPLAVELIGVALASGSAIEVAVRRTAQVIPMPMSDELDAAVARLMVGTDPELVWADLSGIRN
ncbi:MAG: hypothetical protein HZY75_02275 [Nocardioidaceae bacterium]|nr:MAG: hypothetical protein HZY75_02275 [Nocardioidaceae bacterium]